MLIAFVVTITVTDFKEANVFPGRFSSTLIHPGPQEQKKEEGTET
jgi:hypothetical protein